MLVECGGEDFCGVAVVFVGGCGEDGVVLVLVVSSYGVLVVAYNPKYLQTLQFQCYYNKNCTNGSSIIR